MKNIRQSLLFSVILLFGEKSANKATLYQIALNSLTSMRLLFLYPLDQKANTSRRMSPAGCLSLSKKEAGMYCSVGHSPDYASLKHFFILFLK